MSIGSKINAFLFGEYALQCGFVKPPELKEALSKQVNLKSQGIDLVLGEVLRDMNLLSNSLCDFIYRKQKLQRESIEGYELIRYLGKGGLGSVFVARQVSLDREVALKIVRLGAKEESAEIIYKEARTIANFMHPNIVSAIDVGYKEGVIYLAMELIEGPDLKQIFKDNGPLSEDDCVEVGVKISDALNYLHQRKCVHRDIKPGNILIDKNNQIKLIDLGLALDVSSGKKGIKTKKGVGTPNYISPEQAMGRLDIDIRSDIYSLGATLYYLSTGEYIFTGKTARDVLVSHVKVEPIPPKEKNANLSDEFSDLILRLVKKQPENRPMPSEASELFQSLQKGTYSVSGSEEDSSNRSSRLKNRRGGKSSGGGRRRRAGRGRRSSRR